MNKIKIDKVKITDGFWKNRNELLANQIVPYQREALNNRIEGVPLSHSVENFKIAAGESKGEPKGTIFQDSDVAKWIEAAAYSLLIKPDSELEAYIDELVRLIGKSQQKDGYLNTFFTAKGISSRWTDLVQGHEMYCAGHLMEAAATYYQATGKKEFVDIMCRYADLISEGFGPEEGKRHSFGGHPEIELALYRLAEVAGRDDLCDLADYFMDVRGTIDDYYRKTDQAKNEMHPDSIWFQSDYYLAHQPVREMREVTGHAVRAVYLYSGMTDYYLRTGDSSLWKTLTSLWENLEDKRVFITGGIGSQGHGERFTLDYDLPSDRTYNESCASIGYLRWAFRMLQADPNSRYSDMIERILYNGVLSGIALDGKSYFYVNPLEVKPEVAKYRHDYEHVETHRQGWFDCSCCPTNIARMIGSYAEYLYTYTDNQISLHQFASSVTEISLKQGSVKLIQQTNFPWDGSIRIEILPENPVDFTLFIRHPQWSPSWKLKINGKAEESVSEEKGYLAIARKWNPGDIIELEWDMPVRFMRADSRVDGLNGKLALTRGPLVYCFEEVDNGKNLQEILVDPGSEAKLVSGDLEPAPSVQIKLKGIRETDHREALYSSASDSRLREEVELTAIPYFQWGNRVPDQEMRIWMRSL